MTTGEALSARDTSLVAMIARGYTTDRAAHALGLSRHTVGEVISMLLARYGCSNRASLVAYCYVHRLLPSGIWPPPYSSPGSSPANAATGRRHLLPARPERS